jgi:hypothetical protein
MRLAFAALVLIALTASVFAQECISCEEMAGRPTAQILTVNDDTAHVLEIYAFYENLSAEPSRQPINNTIIIVEMTNSTGLKELRKTYTNSEGKARFDFNTWKNGCITFKVLYCPFCDPTSPECGFAACLNFSLIETTAKNANEISDGPGGYAAPGTLNSDRYLPALDQISYCPLPPSMASTPALCLPLLIIFSLLSGALYLTGRNPWGGFNVGGAHVGKHIRYQARGRGFSLDLKSAIMSISSAAGEMKKDEKGVREGSKTEAKYFGYSNIRDLGDVIVGTGDKGSTGKGGVQSSATMTLGSGRRQRPGIAGAFSKAKRDARASTVRAFGERVDKSGRPVGPGSGPVAGRAFGFGQVMKSWGTEFGLSLGRIGATLFDASFLSAMTNIFTKTNVSLSSSMENAVAGSRRETGARAISESELFTDKYGTRCSDPNRGVGFAAGRSEVDTDGTRTGTPGKSYVRVDAEGLGLPSGSVVVATVENVGLGGQSTITIHVSSGTGDNRQLTNWRLESGVVTGFERIQHVGTADQVGFSYRLGPNNTVVAVGITVPSGIGAPTMMEVHRDSKGQITGIGSYEIQRGPGGAITGMYDRGLPSAEPGKPGTEVGKGSPAYAQITELLSMDGKNLSSMSGIQSFNAANLREVTTRTMENVNASLERTQRVYMEQYGLVDVTDHNVLNLNGEGERNKDGTPKADTRGDFTVRIVDASYTPTGEKADRTGLEPGTILSIKNDTYQSVTGPKGENLLTQTAMSQGEGETSYQTSIKGSNIVLGSSSNKDDKPDASGVNKQIGGFYEAVTNMNQAYDAYQNAIKPAAGEQFRDRNPALVQNLEEASKIRHEGGETLEAQLKKDGVPRPVADAAGLLYEGTPLSSTDVSVSADVLRGKKEFDNVFSAAIRTGNEASLTEESMTPRAQAYLKAMGDVREAYESKGVPFNPDDPNVSRQIESAMRPAMVSIDKAERQVIENLGSSDPKVRAQAEQDVFRLGILPPGTEVPSHLTLANMAAAAYGNHKDNYEQEVIDTRIQGNTTAIMQSHPELVSQADPPLGRAVAGHMLGLGTELCNMNDETILANVRAGIMRDPNITPENRDEAMKYASDYLAQARSVASNFDQAEHKVADEITSNRSTYMPFDADRLFNKIVPADAFKPQPPDSPDAREYAERVGIDLNDPAKKARFEQAWKESEARRVETDRYLYQADVAGSWASAESSARSNMPGSSDSARTDMALGTFVAQQTAYINETNQNPLGFDEHMKYLGVAASGGSDPNMKAFEGFKDGSGDISAPGYTPERPDYKKTNPEEQIHTYDGRAMAGYVAGTRTFFEVADSKYGGEIPAENYKSATDAIRSFNDGKYPEAYTGFKQSSEKAAEFVEKRQQEEAEKMEKERDERNRSSG